MRVHRSTNIVLETVCLQVVDHWPDDGDLFEKRNGLASGGFGRRGLCALWGSR
jgi:hypothetical protein